MFSDNLIDLVVSYIGTYSAYDVLDDNIVPIHGRPQLLRILCCACPFTTFRQGLCCCTPERSKFCANYLKDIFAQMNRSNYPAWHPDFLAWMKSISHPLTEDQPGREITSGRRSQLEDKLIE